MENSLIGRTAGSELVGFGSNPGFPVNDCPNCGQASIHDPSDKHSFHCMGGKGPTCPMCFGCMCGQNTGVCSYRVEQTKYKTDVCAKCEYGIPYLV